MANDEHLAILKKGVEDWNQWRKQNREISPDLSATDLSGVNLRGSNLSVTNLRGADLSRVNMIEVDLGGAFLEGANLSQADLNSADLYVANLRGADLSHVDLGFANVIGTHLENATLEEAEIGFTRFADNDLSAVIGLETVRHSFPSSIGIDTIYMSKGNIPEVFLRGAGVPEDFIVYMRSLSGRDIEFYSCFISFTESDDLFAQRLYNDLQEAGIRCWRWKEDAKWGKALMRSIDEAVRTYDKLIVICSEQSLNSPAVIREIERALQKEDELARHGDDSEVLFPIRLDDYIFDGWNHHRKADVITKTIGDFRQWKNSEIYYNALNRLIRDLQAEKPK
jgi:uncharacterized protein YjbI with pentapeptide repeats